MKLVFVLILNLVAVSAYAQDIDVLGNCQILPPNVPDNNQHYCSGSSYGVTYKGYVASNHCYDTLPEAVKAMRAIKSCKKEDSIGKCKILKPNVRDENGRNCGETDYAVTYNGYVIENKCHPSIDLAMTAMAPSLCSQEDFKGDFAILYPNKTDLNSRYCSDTSFGVMYKGISVDSICYGTLREALEVMKTLEL